MSRRVIVVQPTVPPYRVDFFDKLSNHFGSPFLVYASAADIGDLGHGHRLHRWERLLGPIRMLPFGLAWQRGALSIPLSPGDVVIVSGAPRCLSNVALLLKVRFVGARTIWWGHYWSSTSRSWRFAIRLLIMRRSHNILFYTDKELAEYRARRDDRGKAKLFALNNGIEAGQVITLRAAYDGRVRGRRALFIGRLTPKAELGLLFFAMADSRCHGVTLDVIGEGPEQPALRALASKLGVRDRVVWHGGTINEALIATVANQCALFVYPGAVGLSLIHALTYGLPAIVHDDRWGHMPEIAAFAAGSNGLTFVAGNVESLAERLAFALSDPNRLNEMSRGAIETTAATFNVDDMVERFCEAVDSSGL